MNLRTTPPDDALKAERGYYLAWLPDEDYAVFCAWHDAIPTEVGRTKHRARIEGMIEESIKSARKASPAHGEDSQPGEVWP